MKTLLKALLLLLLLTLVAFISNGQDTTYLNFRKKIIELRKASEKSAKKAMGTKWVIPPPETPITIEDLERWVEYCYNDSTEIVFKILYEKPQPNSFGWFHDEEVKEVWTHKDPGIVPELIKFLKQKK